MNHSVKAVVFALVPLFFVVLILPVHAVDIDITEFDDRMGEALGMDAFAGGLIISFFVWFVFTVFAAMITRKFPSPFYLTLQTVIILSMCIAFGWFPVYTLVLIVLFVAFGIGAKVLKVF